MYKIEFFDENWGIKGTKIVSANELSYALKILAKNGQVVNEYKPINC